jgi:hypothetical protein
LPLLALYLQQLTLSSLLLLLHWWVSRNTHMPST